MKPKYWRDAAAIHRALAIILAGAMAPGCTLGLDTELAAPPASDAGGVGPDDAPDDSSAEDAEDGAADAATADTPRDAEDTTDRDAPPDTDRDSSPDDADAGDTASDPPTEGDLEPPLAPTGISASRGTSSDFVEVSWSAVEGADSYTVYRDDAAIAEGVTDTRYTDLGATPGGPPSATGFDLAASQGNYADRVELSWSEPESPPGPYHEYRVVAVNAAGPGPSSAIDSGRRAALPIAGYEIRIDGGDWVAAEGTGFVHDDASPPLALDVLDGGAADAGDGASIDGVPLSLASVELGDLPASQYAYEVRAVNDSGAGEVSAGVFGWASPMAMFQWQRRRLDLEAADFEDMPGATSQSFTDLEGPIGGPADYRCLVIGADSSATSASDQGARLIQTMDPSSLVPGARHFANRVAVSGTHAAGMAWSSHELVFFEFYGRESGWQPVFSDDRYNMFADQDIDGDYAVAGRFPADEAVVYEFVAGDPDTWAIHDTLPAPEGVTANFARNVAIDGDLIGVSSEQSESAFLYRLTGDNWLQEDELTPSETSAAFGQTIGLDNAYDRIIVGGPLDIVIFERVEGTWTRVFEIGTAALGNYAGSLSSDATIDGDWAAAGNYEDGDTNTYQGAIYLFQRSPLLGDWSHVGTIYGEALPPGHFGDRVVIVGDDLVTNAFEEEAAYHFHLDPGGSPYWRLQERMVSPLGAGESFGNDVAFDGHVVVVGAAQEGTVATGTGFVYWLHP